MNLFIFGALPLHLRRFAGDFMRLFSSQESVSHRTGQQTKGLRQLLSKLSCRFRSRGTATPYVHPVRPKVTQCHPRLRASAEGRNPKMRKPGMSWVNDWWHNRHRLACRLLTANCLIFQRPSNPGSWVASAPSQLALARLSILPALNQSFHRDRTLPGKGLSINDHP